jgi:hypothetical protein
VIGAAAAAALAPVAERQKAQAANARAAIAPPNNEPDWPKRSTLQFPKGQVVRPMPAPASTWTLPTTRRLVPLRPTAATLRKRLEATLRFQHMSESIRIRLTPEDARETLRELATGPLRKMMSSSAESDVAAVAAFIQSLEKRLKNDKLKLDARDLRWVDLKKLSRYVEVRSVLPEFDPITWIAATEDSIERSRMEEHFGDDFLRIHQRVQLESEDGQDESPMPLTVLLPSHMEDIYGRYSAFRGRNCFATALQFANKEVISDRSVNMIRESDHHFAMINSDEFINALWRGYTELTPIQIQRGLRYGDVVVFYDRADELGYRSLRHTAVHISGALYFHKPSKSASTPVEFTTWQSLIDSWQRFTRDLDYRVFRKIPLESGIYIDNATRNEKINWTP